MGFDYTTLRAETVEPLIEEFGDDGQLSVNSVVAGDPWDSQLDSPTLYDIKFVRSRFMKDNNNGTLVEKDDSLFIVSTKGVSIDPEMADRIIVDSVSRQVIRMDPLKPGPTTMFWKVHARK